MVNACTNKTPESKGSMRVLLKTPESKWSMRVLLKTPESKWSMRVLLKLLKVSGQCVY